MAAIAAERAGGVRVYASLTDVLCRVIQRGKLPSQDVNVLGRNARLLECWQGIVAKVGVSDEFRQDPANALRISYIAVLNRPYAFHLSEPVLTREHTENGWREEDGYSVAPETAGLILEEMGLFSPQVEPTSIHERIRLREAQILSLSGASNLADSVVHDPKKPSDLVLNLTPDLGSLIYVEVRTPRSLVTADRAVSIQLKMREVRFNIKAKDPIQAALAQAQVQALRRLVVGDDNHSEERSPQLK
jgi:hypothetical protein